MKATICLAASGALLAMAGPVARNEVKTETVWDVAYHTVWVDENGNPETPEPTEAPKQVFAPGLGKVKPVVTKTETEQAEETVVVTTIVEQAPAPSPEPSQPAPAPAPSPEPAPQPAPQPSPEPSPEPAPVVQAPAAPAKEEKPAPAPVQQADSPPTDFKSTATWYHNVHRDNHTAQHVTYNDEIAGYAAQLASTCKMAHDT